ncbi:hypothetical protein HK096_009797, partial [Nowakowskiella sp. JEL0078]
MAPPGFVQLDDSKFVRDGKPYAVVGANYWQAGWLGMEKAPGNRERLAKDLKQMADLGFTNLRLMASCEGPESEPFRIVPAITPKPNEINEDALVGLDYALDQLNELGLTAVITLNNQWQWSGGFSQYVKWADEANGNFDKIPYPSSYDSRTREFFDGITYEEFELYGSRFYKDDSIKDICQKWWKKHIELIINRKNTVNGKLYKEDPTIFAWQLANEPQTPPKWWIDESTAFIKSLDSEHLVNVGSETKHTEPDEQFLINHAPSTVDYTTCHLWVQNWNIYDGSDSSPENLQKAQEFADNFLSQRGQWAKQLGKPIVLEEFGIARDQWLDQSNLYNPELPVSN